MHENEYTDEFVAKLELMWGDGFLAPGGQEETARMLEGVDLTGLEILDIGCGVGGVDVLLARDYGAKSVIGLDIEEPLVMRCRERAARMGLSDKLTFQLVEPGPLPFANASFDAVFSKEAMIHISDKAALFAEVLRVLRPGGMFLASDWMQSADGPNSPEMTHFVENSGLSFDMGIVDVLPAQLQAVGFEQIQVTDRNPWYSGEVHKELARMRGDLREPLLELLGREKADLWIVVREAMIKALDSGVFHPTHFRAVKPG
jgi:phosphoethanolamine N-methyltransferase